jgi:hypothetical protein
VAAAAAQPPVDPMQQLMHGAVKAGVLPLPAYLQSIAPKQPEYKTVGDALVQVGPGGRVTEAYRSPDKDPEALRTLGIIYGKGSPQYQKAAQDLATKMTTHQPGTTVNVDNLGLKPKDRFDMEGKLADDYTAGTKLDGLVLQSTGKIRAALAQPGAIKDQAAIYAFAKMLDPEGAVREADYAAIANTAGLKDRVLSAVKRLQTGEMLTDNQRQDMTRLADAFEKNAKNRIAAKQKDYGTRAKRYNLEPASVFGPAESQAPQIVNFGDLK